MAKPLAEEKVAVMLTRARSAAAAPTQVQPTVRSLQAQSVEGVTEEVVATTKQAALAATATRAAATAVTRVAGVMEAGEGTPTRAMRVRQSLGAARGV